jgi:hypothetical protein
VAADAGGELTVLAQNQAADGGADATRGRRVRIVWARAHNRRVEAGREGKA